MQDYGKKIVKQNFYFFLVILFFNFAYILSIIASYAYKGGFPIFVELLIFLISSVLSLIVLNNKLVKNLLSKQNEKDIARLEKNKEKN